MKIEELDLEKVKKLAQFGHDDKFIADFFNIPLRTFLDWKKSRRDFKEALEYWRKNATENVERALYQKATGYTHESEEIHVTKSERVLRTPTTKQYPPDTDACKFWLKNMAPKNWADKIEQKISGDVEFKIAPSNLEDRLKLFVEEKLAELLE